MANKFFVSAHAGCIGYTKNGYPIHDFSVVRMVTSAGKERFFQLQERFGVEINGKWCEAEHHTRRSVSSDDTSYDDPFWEFNGKEIPKDKLIKKYDIIEISELVLLAKRYDNIAGWKKSPYVNAEKLSEAFRCGSCVQLDGRTSEFNGIIKAMKAYLRKEKEDKKHKDGE